MIIQITVNGTTYPIKKDVTHQHPQAVHEAMGTSSEDELQAALDMANIYDWYNDDGSYRGPDEDGLEIIAEEGDLD